MEITPFDLAGSLQAHNQLVQQQNAIKSQNALAQAVPLLQSDPQNAFATAARTSPDAALKLLPYIKEMNDQKKAAIADRASALGKAALTLKQYGDPVIRKAVAMTMAPDLAQHGITPDQIQNFDYSDQNLQATINNSQSVGDIIKQANTDRSFGLQQQTHADTVNYQNKSLGIQAASHAETARHDRAIEGAMTGPVDPIALANDPVVGSHVKNILSGNETMAQVPAAIRNKVSVALQRAGSGSYSPLAGARLTLASSRITAPYTNMASYKLTSDGLPYLQRIDAALKTPGSVSDQDLLDSLTKLNTGGNAVTDAQVKLITDGKSFSDTIGAWGNKLKNGGVLSDNQRQQIKAIANDIFANYRKGYQPVYEKAASQLKAAGIPEQYWTIPDLNKLNAGQADILADKPAAAAATPANSKGWSNFKVHN